MTPFVSLKGMCILQGCGLIVSVCVYDSDSDSDDNVYNSPCSYRQPSGKGHSLSRRYCKHSERFFRYATRTASSFQGALTVSCKYFKQSK